MGGAHGDREIERQTERGKLSLREPPRESSGMVSGVIGWRRGGFNGGGVFVLYKFGENEQLIMQVKKIILI